MTAQQRYVLVVVLGWVIPFACVLLGHQFLAFAAVAIAWWHGYVAAKLEAKLASAKQVGST